MHRDQQITIDGLTRIEGHGNIVVDIRDGSVKDVRLEVVEPPRFFEALLRGRHYEETAHIISRICGICSASHCSASLKAIEDALGIRVSAQTTLLRELALCAETIQSHILNLYFLVLRDMMGTPSALTILRTEPTTMEPALKLKALANHISTVLNGRSLHPIAFVPGGTTHLPERTELVEIRDRLYAATSLIERIWQRFKGFSPPEFELIREFISLRARRGYGFYHGIPYSSIDGTIEQADFASWITEYVASHSTAKQAKSPHGTYMVGALARLNNNHRRLKPLARRLLKDAPFTIPCHIPFMNNLAQIIECMHLVEYAIEIIDRLVSTGLKPSPPAGPTRYGRGIGIVEAPRGILYHSYTIGEDGTIESANCIIPTAQNLRSIEEDLRELTPRLIPSGKEAVVRWIEGLVRAYDPCISCSTHIMDVDFV